MSTANLLLVLALGIFIVIGDLSISQRRSPPRRQASFADNPEKRRVEDVRKELFADPFNEQKLQTYLAVLPKDDELYVVEGDLLLTEQEIRAYVVAKSQTQSPTFQSGELLVNIHNGNRDYYQDPSQRNLTYAVDKNSFSNESEYRRAVTNMREAGKSWQNICPTCRVRFTYLSQHDNSPTHGKVNFIVRLKNANGKYIAAAFFPHDSPLRRYVNIDPSYFTTNYNKVGVLRHELGHTLGYRHEHTRNVPGCFFEDDEWLPLTAYDPKSVMHYFCGGGGGLSLSITQTDRSGHRRLYKLPCRK